MKGEELQNQDELMFIIKDFCLFETNKTKK